MKCKQVSTSMNVAAFRLPQYRNFQCMHLCDRFFGAAEAIAELRGGRIELRDAIIEISDSTKAIWLL
ncbi:hypothetical protein [Paraburkholderia sp.]|uniref:hypothetical protein n=1 Tax=Paraburkholderia sp. TaxID=1926495 RepID=UPI003C7AB327